MGDYAKESSIPIKSVTSGNVNISVGDKVKITDFYMANYLMGSSWKDKEAEVIKITSRKISDEKLKEDKDAYRMFIGKYGKLSMYDIIGLEIKYPGDNHVYMVSPFGYEKV